ncbi:MAG TPA: glycosyltransferase family 2 protein [Coxiellaceae bacterium]|nr:MAG: glycosyl transferase [Gammaproteobacteria bacterium RIFCSPHIGHO2_12_FULL_36_30]HLB55913.1 glycosyltransferase family 2 protein [Coxiellaceae bacterium]
MKLLTQKNPIIRFLYPRLGKLHQHSPKPFVIPKSYYRPKPLSLFPKISIVTPSFNQGIFLEKTILSVVQQKYPDIEFIIQDGESKDNSVEVIKKYQDRLNFWESKKDNGQSHAINLGFTHSSGDIMAYLNSDDLLLPGTLNYVAHYFETHPDVDVVYGHRIVIDENNFEVGRWILPPHSNEMLDWIDFVPQETLFWRRKIWNKAGGFIDENFQFAMDWDLLLRFKNAGANFARLPRFLGAFRVHSLQKTSSQMNETGFKEMTALRLRSHNRVVSQSEIKRKMIPYFLKHIVYHKLHRLKNIFITNKI